MKEIYQDVLNTLRAAADKTEKIESHGVCLKDIDWQRLGESFRRTSGYVPARRAFEDYALYLILQGIDQDETDPARRELRRDMSLKWALKLAGFE